VFYYTVREEKKRASRATRVVIVVKSVSRHPL
jgi:hypothetical protein